MLFLLSAKMGISSQLHLIWKKQNAKKSTAKEKDS
jgi:hypothetical protein